MRVLAAVGVLCVAILGASAEAQTRDEICWFIDDAQYDQLMDEYGNDDEAIDGATHQLGSASHRRYGVEALRIIACQDDPRTMGMVADAMASANPPMTSEAAMWRERAARVLWFD